MPPPKNRILWLVVLAHLIILLLVILISAPAKKEFYTNPVTAVELVAAITSDFPPAEETSSEPEPEPLPEPEPEMAEEPIPEMSEEPIPEVKPDRKEKPPPRKIIRQVAPPPIPRADIQKRLRERLEKVQTTGPASPTGPMVSASREGRFPYSWYNNFVQSKMYNLWKRPLRSAVGREQATAVVAFRVFRDGHIENIHLQESSGSKVMDDSALQAARMADPLPPLPPGFKGAHEDFVILFELK